MSFPKFYKIFKHLLRTEDYKGPEFKEAFILEIKERAVNALKYPFILYRIPVWETELLHNKDEATKVKHSSSEVVRGEIEKVNDTLYRSMPIDQWENMKTTISDDDGSVHPYRCWFEINKLRNSIIMEIRTDFIQEKFGGKIEKISPIEFG